MATYTVTGHPLNYATLSTTDQALLTALWNTGVGQTVTLTLSGADDTKVKGHGVLR